MHVRAALAAVLTVGLALAGCGGAAPDRVEGPQSGVASEGQEGPGMHHVHGLGVDPANGVVYAATHFGVFAITDGQARRVGDQQDTMGFTVVGPGTFLGSGHPDFSQDDEPLLGLIRSTDAGRTWEPLSLRGEADFHALEVVDEQVFGFDASTGTFMVSPDGRSWDRRSRVALHDFAVDPQDPLRVLATGREGVLGSADGGRSWEPVAGTPELVLLAWGDRAVYGVDTGGVLHASADGGATWTARGGTGGAPEALTVTEEPKEQVLVAIRDVGIVASEDGGITFQELYRAS